MSVVDYEDRELVDRFERFLRSYYKEEVNQLARDYPDRSSLYVDWADVYRFDQALADDWLANPQQITGYIEEAVQLFDTVIDVDMSDVTVRLYNLHETDSFGVAGLSSDDIGRFVAVEGQIGRVSQTYPHPREAAFECKRCGTTTRIPQPDNDIQQPHECQGCERQGPFTLNRHQTDWEDRQRLRITQPPEETMGGQGATADVFLAGDAVEPLNEGKLKAGNRVTVTAEKCIQLDTDGGGTEMDEFLDADHVEVEDTDYNEINITQQDIDRITRIAAGAEGDPYELCMESLAPGHHGDESIKLALVLQMFRGVRSQRPDGSWERGDSHVLLIGDPGVGKSSLLRRVSEVAPRSTFASGKGASAAGMTAAAVPSDFGDEKWSIEAGALALADQGIACVDEIDKVKEDAVSSMHAALESPQVVEVDKADIHATLPARSSLLAAGNPKYGRFDDYEPLNEQIDIEPTLLSRFDLMFVMKDDPGEDEDKELAQAIIESRQTAHRHDHGGPDATDDDVEPPFTDEFLRKYVAYARRNVYPSIEEDHVAEKLVDLFLELRSAAYDQDDAPIPITLRKIQAMQRLAEASARIRLSDTVEVTDVNRVADLVIRSMNQLGVNEDGQFDADVVETGVSKSQRDRIKSIKSLLSEMAKEIDQGGGGVPLDELAGKARNELDIERDRVERELNKLCAKGEVYEPATDEFLPT